jgi:hypothetical protein
MSPAQPSHTPFRFHWILDAKKDLVFYLGSALAGWFYAAVVYYAIRILDDPLKDSLGYLSLGGLYLPLTLELLVVASWAFVLDAPHVWVTLARTLFDPDEWQTRGPELARSFGWFALGPLCVVLPYAIGSLSAPLGYPLPTGVMALGIVVFLVGFRLWAYYHVVRQHWGFFSLYKRKAQDHAHAKLDYWFFNLTMYLPLIIFISGPAYAQVPDFPDLGLQTPVWNQWSMATLLYPLAWLFYLGIIAVYAAFQIHLYRQGMPLNASKLLYMALLIPLHLIAFVHPIMAVFLIPLITVGHNIQYLCIVYTYGRNKYTATPDRRYRWVRPLFKNVAVYGLVGLVFTFGFYRGPWIDWLQTTTGLGLDQVLLNSLGMMAGIRNPASLGLGEQLLGAALLGFAMQHYYLDAKIWRVRKDKEVRKYLKV